MAIAVIGGLMASTLLSLVFVPAAFSLIDSLGGAIWWVFGRFVGKADEAEHDTVHDAGTFDHAPTARPAAGLAAAE